ncbi:hypothetical protein VTJ83DRAFT_130 [Remersonia thermophila]|uniref:Fork-head domain-containing protein n=1 Tax=Remersonia thermophila TaxID=72144 RepID=A0ABR4DK72_9PEZI
MEPMFGPAPRQGAQHISPPPGPTSASQQLLASTSSPRTCDGHGVQEDNAQHDWTTCFGGPSSFGGGSLFDNYTLRSSPPAASNVAGSGLDPSSPRSWSSLAHATSASWEAAAPDQLSDALQNLDPRLAGCRFSWGQQDPDLAAVASCSSGSFTLVADQGCTPSDDGLQGLPSTGVPFLSEYRPSSSSQNAYPLTPESGLPLSPCSTTLSLSMDLGPSGSPGDSLALLGTHQDEQRQKPPPDPSEGTESAGKTSPSQAPTSTGCETKTEEPYAKLIHRAFMSTPRRAMTLQEIYQWFRENTDKGKDDTKGWQNSIRHNLSMNQAFQKRERPSGGTPEGDSNSLGDGKKSTEWYLMDWAIDGVESTTRYRKENQSRRAAAQAAAAGRLGQHSGTQYRVYRSSYTPPHAPGKKHAAPVARRTRQGLRSNSNSNSSNSSSSGVLGGISDRGVVTSLSLSHPGGSLYEPYHPFGPHHFTSFPAPPEMVAIGYGGGSGGSGDGGPVFYHPHPPPQAAAAATAVIDLALAPESAMMEAMAYEIPPPSQALTPPRTGPSEPSSGMGMPDREDMMMMMTMMMAQPPHPHQHPHQHLFYQQESPPAPASYPIAALPAASMPVPVAPMYDEPLGVGADGFSVWGDISSSSSTTTAAAAAVAGPGAAISAASAAVVAAAAAGGLNPMQVMEGLSGMPQLHGGHGIDDGEVVQQEMGRRSSTASYGSIRSSSSSTTTTTTTTAAAAAASGGEGATAVAAGGGG